MHTFRLLSFAVFSSLLCRLLSMGLRSSSDGSAMVEHTGFFFLSIRETADTAVIVPRNLEQQQQQPQQQQQKSFVPGVM